MVPCLDRSLACCETCGRVADDSRSRYRCLASRLRSRLEIPHAVRVRLRVERRYNREVVAEVVVLERSKCVRHSQPQKDKQLKRVVEQDERAS